MKAFKHLLLAVSIVACLMVLVPCALALENTEVTESAPEGADQAEKSEGGDSDAEIPLTAGYEKMARHEAQAQVQTASARAQQATATELQNFKKAFSVCLEAKYYMVKF